MTGLEAPRRRPQVVFACIRNGGRSVIARVLTEHYAGEAITALCGKKWVPTRDPTRYPICPTCVERKNAGWTL